MASKSKMVAESVGGGSGEVALQQNEKQIDNDYTIPAGVNAMIAGPIVLATDADITIPTGSTLSIV
jgi:hypothetical protein